MSPPPSTVRELEATGQAVRPRRAPGHRELDPLAFLALPAGLYFLVALIIPLGLLFGSSLRVGDALSLENYARFLRDPHNQGVVWNTIKYGLVVTAGCLAIGYPYALAMARVSGGRQTLLLVGVFLPMTASVIVKAFGWTILLRSNGVVNQAIMGIGLTGEPVQLLFSQTGLFLGTVSILLAFMILPVYSVLRLIPQELDDAAASLGATSAYRFVHVILPLSRSGVLAGCAFVFSMTVSAYVIPSVLTGAGYQVMSKVIAYSYLTVRDPALGSTVSVLLLLIAGSAVIVSGWLAGERRMERRWKTGG